MPCRAVREFVVVQRLQVRHLADQARARVRQDDINERKAITVKPSSQRNVSTYARLTSSGGIGCTSHILLPCPGLLT